MKKYIYLTIALLSFSYSISQKVYNRDKPEEFYIDLDTKTAKIQYDTYLVSGNIEQIKVDYINNYLLVNGGDIHLVLEQYSSSNIDMFEEFWLFRGDYKDVLKSILFDLYARTDEFKLKKLLKEIYKF